jgi:hypothetical protein
VRLLSTAKENGIGQSSLDDVFDLAARSHSTFPGIFPDVIEDALHGISDLFSNDIGSLRTLHLPRENLYHHRIFDFHMTQNTEVGVVIVRVTPHQLALIGLSGSTTLRHPYFIDMPVLFSRLIPISALHSPAYDTLNYIYFQV